MWEEKVMSEKEKKYVGTKFSTGELVQMELEAKAKKQDVFPRNMEASSAKNTTFSAYIPCIDHSFGL